MREKNWKKKSTDLFWSGSTLRGGNPGISGNFRPRGVGKCVFLYH